MHNDPLHHQAIQLETLLPSILRRMFTLDLEDALSELTQGQRRLCLILSQNGALTLSQVCEELGISHAAATQIADRLERVKMVERIICPADRRVKYLQLSSHGLELMQAWHDRRIRRAEQTLARLSEEERGVTLSMLSRLVEVLSEQPFSVQTPISNVENSQENIVESRIHAA